MVFVDGVANLQIFGIVDIQEFCSYKNRKNLTNFFFGRKLAKSFLRPFFTFVVKVYWPGLLVFIACVAKSDERTNNHRKSAKLSQHQQTIAWEQLSGLGGIDWGISPVKRTRLALRRYNVVN